MNLDLVPIAYRKACARLIEGADGLSQPAIVRRRLRALECAGLVRYDSLVWRLTSDGKLARTAAHADAAGEMCTEDASGCCKECGVSLMGGACRECKCRGYHRKGCSLIDTFDPTDGGA